MKCGFCKKKIEEDASICSGCHASIEWGGQDHVKTVTFLGGAALFAFFVIENKPEDIKEYFTAAVFAFVAAAWVGKSFKTAVAKRGGKSIECE